MQWGFIFPIRLFLLSVPSENLQLKVREQNEAWEDIVGEELIKIQLLVWVKGTFVRGAFLIQPNKPSIGWNSENSLCTCHISSLYKSRGLQMFLIIAALPVYIGISQCLFPAIPLCIIHLFEVPPEVMGDDAITSSFWIGRIGFPARGSRHTGGAF